MANRRKNCGEATPTVVAEDTLGVSDILKLFQENDERRRKEDVAREEQRRQQEAVREEKLQTLLMSMVQLQMTSQQQQQKDLETARLADLDRSRQLEEQRLVQLEEQKQLDEKRHLELMALEREKIEIDRQLQAEREKTRQQEELRRQKERELDRKLREAPSLPRMPETTDLELYIADFEHHMRDLEIPTTRWLTSLRPLLSLWAREILDLMGEADKLDYSKVKKALLDAYCNEKGSLGHRLVSTKRTKGQTAAQYLIRRQRMWKHWTESWDKEEAGARLNMELFYSELPYACRNHCRERDPQTPMELAAVVDKFFSDRDSSLDDPKWSRKQQPITREHKGSPEGTTPLQTRRTGRQRDPNWEAKIECFICKQKGHAAYRCPQKPEINAVDASNKGLLIDGMVGDKPATLLLDSGASLTLVPPELTTASNYTGRQRTVMGATGPGTFPVYQTTVTVGEKIADMTVLVKKGLTQPLLGRDFPGFYDLVVDAIKRAENHNLVQEDAHVLAVQTRLQKQHQEATRTADDLASATSGAVPTHLSDIDDSLFGVSKTRKKLSRGEKRTQAKKRTSSTTVATLKTFTPTEFEVAQVEDESLQSLWAAAEKGEQGYVVKGSILYHTGYDEWDTEIQQIVVPQKFRKEIMTLAHSSILASHPGVKKTIKRILKVFFWPGLSKDAKDYCLACEQCQKGGKANRKQAPLQPLPTVDEPFKRIAIDIVGPLRRTKRGNKYILTMMDFATRYPEAIPLRKIDATTVAEALCEVFTRLGLPEEMLSDQGSNFTSNLMKQVLDLLQIHHLKTSPYHPQTDGMLERFHGTLKGMMRKNNLAQREWDEYLPYVCFAVRDSVHSATGFTPFQLLFGRDVRGPLTLLRHQLTGDTTGSRPVVDFVTNLKTKLDFAWTRAAECDGEAKAKSKRYFDRKSKARTFEIGEQVLVLSPSETDKFQAQWSGPYTVEERATDVTYRVSTPEKRKRSRLFHVNSIKPWTTPTAILAVRYCENDEDSVTDSALPLYPYEADVDNEPQIHPMISTVQRQQLTNLLKEKEIIFSPRPGHTTLAVHSINTGDSKPIYHAPYRIPTAWQHKVRQEIQKMLDEGIIKPSTSPWTSPIVPVKKKDGSMRLCVDYRKLNSITQDDRYPMPRVDEMLEQLGGASYISTLDLTQGYYQVPVAIEDQEKTAFVAPTGKYHFTRMPFGLKGAPTTFQRLMDRVLEPCHEYASAYIDDIVIFSTTWEAHLQHLKQVCQQLEKAGLKVKARKCCLAMEECTYLGHRVGKGAITLEDAKVTAIANFQQPKTKKDIRSFLGLTGYYRRFISGYADLTANLSDLVRKDKPNVIVWSDMLQADFIRLKKELCSKPILRCPDNTKPFNLQTDASEKGLGAVLSQIQDDGLDRPIAFFSRKLLPRERNYSTVEKECLGIVAALKHFEVYLAGQEFQITTDHRALKYLNTMKNSNPRLTRWSLALQPYNFRITHKAGQLNGNADGLSRQAWNDDEPPASQQERKEGMLGL